MTEQFDLLADPQIVEECAAPPVQPVESDRSFWDSLWMHQQECIVEVRRHIKAGKKNILICAPTGSGKTRVATYIIGETARNLKRANFVVDRINLVDQTAEVFDQFGINFGVHQASHWKYRPWERVQLCSAQTLARRKWPEAEICLVDEAHTLYDTVKTMMDKRERITIGLTATPFTKGLGLHFDALVNVTTTNKLIDQGVLSPYRIFAAKSPDMTGVSVKAGEWDTSDPIGTITAV